MPREQDPSGVDPEISAGGGESRPPSDEKPPRYVVFLPAGERFLKILRRRITDHEIESTVLSAELIKQNIQLVDGFLNTLLELKADDIPDDSLRLIKEYEATASELKQHLINLIKEEKQTTPKISPEARQPIGKIRAEIESWKRNPDELPAEAREFSDLIQKIESKLSLVDAGYLTQAKSDLEEYKSAFRETQSLRQLEKQYENPQEVADFFYTEYREKVNNLIQRIAERIAEIKREDEEQTRQARSENVENTTRDLLGNLGFNLQELDAQLQKDIPTSVAAPQLADLAKEVRELEKTLGLFQNIEQDFLDEVERDIRDDVQRQINKKRNTVALQVTKLQNLFTQSLITALSKADGLGSLSRAFSIFEKLQHIEKKLGDPDPDADNFAQLALLTQLFEELSDIQVDRKRFDSFELPLSDKNITDIQNVIKEWRNKFDLVIGTQNPGLTKLIEEINTPKKPLYHLNYAQLKQLRHKVRYERFVATANLTLTPALKQQADKAIARVEEAFRVVENKNPKEMSWDDLVAEITTRGIDVFNHPRFQQAISDDTDRAKQLYLEFTDRYRRQPGESFVEGQRRIDAAVQIQLSLVSDELQYEGQKASGYRDGMLEQLSKKEVKRDELLKAVQYHPIYGKFIREVLEYIIKQTTDDNSEISYNSQISEHGRRVLQNHIKRKFSGDLSNVLFESEGDEKIDNISRREEYRQKRYGDIPKGDEGAADRDHAMNQVFGLIFNTYYSFNLIDVGFADLQKNTRTKGHDKKSKIDYTLLYRPDAAMIHRSLRYGNLSDWSLNTLLKLQYLPKDLGRKSKAPNDLEETRNELLAIQNKLILAQEAYYDTDSFTRENGIKPSALFDEWFPTTLALISLGINENLVFGDLHKDEQGKGYMEWAEGAEVWGYDESKNYTKLDIYIRDEERMTREGIAFASKPEKSEDNEDFFSYKGYVNTIEQYGVAEGGWKQILETDLGNLPPVVTGERITGNSEDKDKGGLIMPWISKMAGTAKMFQGEYLERVFVQYLTHHIFRVFSRFPATGTDREHVFLTLVKQMRKHSQPGGLSSYAKLIDTVIENISYPGKPGLVSSDNLQLKERRDQRKRYVDLIYREKGWPIPSKIDTRAITNENPRIRRYWKIVNRETGGQLPSTEIDRLGSLEKIKEETDK